MDPIDEAQKIDNGWEWDCLVAERDALQARVAELEAGEKHYQTRLARIASMAGNPDPAQACRLIIQAATEPV